MLEPIKKISIDKVIRGNKREGDGEFWKFRVTIEGDAIAEYEEGTLK